MEGPQASGRAAAGRSDGRRSDGRRSVVASSVEGLSPAAFAFVMATGIISSALARGATLPLSTALLALGLAGYAVLLGALGWRLLRWRHRVVTDLTGPSGFGFLTGVAAADVLASRFASGGHTAAATILLVVGAAGWLLLGYGVPLALIVRAERRPSLDQLNGSWFLWAVATQSVAVAAAYLGSLVHGHALHTFAWVCWAIGIVQYLLTAALALARLLVRPVAPADLIPSYWIFMGAAAISVLAGAKILELPVGDSPLPHAVTSGLSAILWSFCTWLIPLLLVLGWWRHVVRRVPLRYDTNAWSLVFPIGMYGVATRELGRATGTSWLTALGSWEERVAAVVWAVVFVAMVAEAIRTLRGAGPRPAGP